MELDLRMVFEKSFESFNSSLKKFLDELTDDIVNADYSPNDMVLSVDQIVIGIYERIEKYYVDVEVKLLSVLDSYENDYLRTTTSNKLLRLLYDDSFFDSLKILAELELEIKMLLNLKNEGIDENLSNSLTAGVGTYAISKLADSKNSLTNALMAGSISENMGIERLSSQSVEIIDSIFSHFRMAILTVQNFNKNVIEQVGVIYGDKKRFLILSEAMDFNFKIDMMINSLDEVLKVSHILNDVDNQNLRRKGIHNSLGRLILQGMVFIVGIGLVFYGFSDANAPVIAILGIGVLFFAVLGFIKSKNMDSVDDLKDVNDRLVDNFNEM